MSNNIISLSKEILDEMDECACACGAKVGSGSGAITD